MIGSKFNYEIFGSISRNLLNSQLLTQFENFWVCLGNFQLTNTGLKSFDEVLMCVFSLGEYGNKGEAKTGDFLKLKIYLKLQ